MAKRNRITLKNFFVRGKMPTEEHFSDLIDSMLNIVDEGFEKTPKNGLSLAPLDEDGHVISIFQKIEDEESKWSVTLEKSTGNLIIRQFDGNPLMVFSQDGKIGIGRELPQYQLQTTNTIGLHGRAGTYASGEVPADSQWQNVLETDKGCFAFEIIAGCGKQQFGKYALLVATAIHCFGDHPRISKTQSHYGSRFNKIIIRWRKINGKSVLQMKTRYDYGYGIMIRYNISSLWDDHNMFKSNNMNRESGQ
jgi:hypothetical protein